MKKVPQVCGFGVPHLGKFGAFAWLKVLVSHGPGCLTARDTGDCAILLPAPARLAGCALAAQSRLHGVLTAIEDLYDDTRGDWGLSSTTATLHC